MCRDFPSRQRRVRVRYGNSLVIVEISQTLVLMISWSENYLIFNVLVKKSELKLVTG